ncbi:MAG: hypothetical protein FWF71_07060 [Actinomycetia bacterium]|nr:hypothetical protein [Actinomycetes bacterium]
MSIELLTGSQAVALGALRAGVNVFCGCHETALFGALEYVGKRAQQDRLEGLSVEWLTGERDALEIAGKAAQHGTYALTAIGQHGLCAVFDVLISQSCLGVSGLALLVADDFDVSDVRQFAQIAKVPLLAPATVEEAEAMARAAFELSERYSTPVVLHLTAVVSHAVVAMGDALDERPPTVSSARPRQQLPEPPQPARSQSQSSQPTALGHARQDHSLLAKRFKQLSQASSASPFNHIEQTGRSAAPAHLGVVASGATWTKLQDAIAQLGYVGVLRLLKIGMPVAFPEKLALEFMNGLSEVLVFEEPEPVIERELLQLVGQKHLKVNVLGKLSGTVGWTESGSTNTIQQKMLDFLSA